MQTIQPSNQYLFCKPAEKETKTASGLLLAKAAETPKQASVINIGTEVKGYERDDVIVYKAYTTNEVSLNGEDYFLIAAEDVLGKIVEN